MGDEVKDFLGQLNCDWMNDFQAESPRGCVLVAHGALESRLADVITGNILATMDTAMEFVSELQNGRNNPLGSFAASIDYAQGHGLIEKWMAKAFRQINSLRVSFAHYELQSPKSPEIQIDEAKSLFGIFPAEEQQWVDGLWGLGESSARRLFLCCSFRLFLILETLIYRDQANPEVATGHEPQQQTQ